MTDFVVNAVYERVGQYNHGRDHTRGKNPLRRQVDIISKADMLTCKPATQPPRAHPLRRSEGYGPSSRKEASQTSGPSDARTKPFQETKTVVKDECYGEPDLCKRRESNTVQLSRGLGMKTCFPEEFSEGTWITIERGTDIAQ